MDLQTLKSALDSVRMSRMNMYQQLECLGIVSNLTALPSLAALANKSCCWGGDINMGLNLSFLCRFVAGGEKGSNRHGREDDEGRDHTLGYEFVMRRTR